MVINNGVSVYRACRMLNINNSTAKAIVRKYQRKGVIFKRKSEGNDVEAVIEIPTL
jgi:transposase